MFEPLRIFGHLLRKSWWVRRRQWKTTLFAQILIPLLWICLLWLGSGLEPNDILSKPPPASNIDLYYEKQSMDDLLFVLPARLPTFYAPGNAFTNELMKYVQECFLQRITIRGFATESDFDTFYRTKKKVRSYPHVVIFDESVDRSTKHLSYKIRYEALFNEVPMTLYNSEASLEMYSKLYRHYSLHNCLVQMQICVDRSFVKIKSGNKPIPDIYIQRVPYPTHTINPTMPFHNLLREMFRGNVVFAYIFSFFIETVRVTKEKVSGANVLMSINGISNTLNLLSWITSAVLFLSILLLLPILYWLTNSAGERLAYVHYGNPLLLYFVMIFYLAHLLTFAIHISAYFSKVWLAIVGLLLADFLLSTVQSLAFSGNTLYLATYFGVIDPHILYNQAMDQIDSYEIRAEGIHWSNIFVNANTAADIGGSVGMTLILSTIGIIFHFLLAIYVYAVRPGKYGVARHPLYFLKYKSKENNDEITESTKDDETSNEYFEPTPEGLYSPGIQIRNLKKTYNVDLFAKQKVDALRGVSVDFYKGQITSLLGHNGAGKTTLISILTGMTSPTEGTVLIDSKDLKKKASEIMRDMGLCTQEDMYFPSLTVWEQVSFFALVKNKDKSSFTVRQDMSALLQKLKLYNEQDSLPTPLSGGQKRRLCLAMALVGDTSTLILDEPTSGLDPESRRVVWNMLLKMRGQKTILISTHDMEEAEILGDRIAIMHSGQLKSYGSSLFLKKLIGQNNVEIALSLEPRSDPERIRSELHKEGIVVRRDATKMVVKIPNTPALPDILDNLEKKKKELGVSGFSVSLISLEQIFVKITQENDGPSNPHQAVDSGGEKLTGTALYEQTVRALLSKKRTYAQKNYSTILIQLSLTLVALLFVAEGLKSYHSMMHSQEELVHLILAMYHKPNVLYTSYDRSLGDRYKTVIQSLGGNPIEVNDNNLESALLKRAKENLFLYDKYLIAAAEFNKSSATAFYSEIATFSLPISVNLLGNTILQNLAGSDYSISVSAQPLPLEIILYTNQSELFAVLVAPIFVLTFSLAIGMFVIHPNRENANGVKQLQKMTGISGLTYWGTTLLVDLIQYSMMAIFLVICFVWIDLWHGFRMYGPKEILLEMLLFVLFGIGALQLLYIYSFLKRKTGTVVMLAMVVPLMLCMIKRNLIRRLDFIQTIIFSTVYIIGMIELILFSLYLILKDSNTMENIRKIQKYTFLLVPYISFLQTQMSFFKTVETNARCHRLPNDFYDYKCHIQKSADICCRLNCYHGRCENSKSFFDDADEDVRLSTSMIYLSATPILYFVILTLLESQFIQKKVCNFKSRHNAEPSSDEQVQREKSIIFERIQTLTGNKPSSINTGTSSNEPAQLTERSPDYRMYLVYELRKSYQGVKAVRDVSFGVDRRECFVLLGVNGAGKSTAFRMMTGAEIPDHGVMYLGDKDFKKNEKYFLSQMGYCPQDDAILDSLNAYDHLKLFAQLRGIPENKVENEVQVWIDNLNLNAYASQPSGTYSGGNKRRLNVAIALIGSPKLILMDEPTTGVDPGAKRSLWNIIKNCQMAGLSVVLTSHSMEECEALCDRLAIMVDGKLVCIGASEELKQRFGAGYDIKIKMDPGKAKMQMDIIKSDVLRSLNCVLIDENLGHLMFHVSPAGTTWRKMYDVMNGIKSKYDSIDEFLVLSSTLEQLFLLFAKTASNSSYS